MRKPNQNNVYVGVDFGHKDHNAEVWVILNSDGTTTVLDTFTWKKEIELSSSEYRVKTLEE